MVKLLSILALAVLAAADAHPRQEPKPPMKTELKSFNGTQGLVEVTNIGPEPVTIALYEKNGPPWFTSTDLELHCWDGFERAIVRESSHFTRATNVDEPQLDWLDPQITRENGPADATLNANRSVNVVIQPQGTAQAKLIARKALDIRDCEFPLVSWDKRSVRYTKAGVDDGIDHFLRLTSDRIELKEPI